MTDPQNQGPEDFPVRHNLAFRPHREGAPTTEEATS
jgi:hypothetical protein